jgi:vacuolar protein sorting-associated protein VTA1
VNQILSRRLHTVNDESKEYTSRLMDKLEKSRAELDGNDAITDEVAAQAVVEHFALETFQRADNAITANKVTA